MILRCRELLVAVTAVMLHASGSVVRADSWAIVVGVNEYPRVRLADGSQPPPLRGAEADADVMANVLIERFAIPKDHLQLLKGTLATRAKLQTAFADVSRQAQPDDLFVFHFSGHGTRVPDRRPFDEEDRLDEALCLADTNGDGENLLIDDDLARWLEDIPARQITVILDCCHAGTGTKAPDDDVVPRFLPLSVATNAIMLPKPAWRELRDMTKGGTRHLTAFFACRSDQQAYERRFPIGKVPAKGGQAPAKAGQFTQALLAGLRDSAADANKDGTITNQELLRFSVERLDDSFNRNRSRPAERQEPLLETEDANSPVFGRSGGR